MEHDLLSLTARGLVAAVAAAERQGALDRPVPSGSAPDAGADAPTVREAARTVAFDLAWVPHTLAGGAVDAGPATREDDLLGEQPVVALGALVDSALAAAGEAPDPDRQVHLSYGDFPAREYLEHISTYYGLLSLDIDEVTGTEPDARLVEGLWELLQPQAEMWRSIGVFGPRVEVADDAPLLDRLKGLTGRQP